MIPAVVEAVETVDRCLGEVRGGGAGARRRLPGHGRPRQRRADAGAGRQPAHRAHHQPGAADRRRVRALAARRAAACRTSRRPCSSCSGSRSPAAMSGRRAAGRVCCKRTRLSCHTIVAWCTVHAVLVTTPTQTWPLPQPDPDILRLARRGDERAFAVIVRQYQTPLLNYMVPGAGRRPGAGRGPVPGGVPARLPGAAAVRLRCQFTTWLFQVAKHRVVDELRARERRGRPAVELDVVRAPDLLRHADRCGRGDGRGLAGDRQPRRST